VAYEVTEEQQDLTRAVAELLAVESSPRSSYDGGPPIDRKLWDQLVSLGFVGLAVAEQHGGGGATLFDEVLVAEQIGAAAAAVPFLATTVGARVLDAFDATELLGRLFSERQVIVAALSAATGLDPWATATVERDRAHLSGTTVDLLEAAAAEVLLVPAEVDGDGGTEWFVVEAADAQLKDQPSLDQAARVAAVHLDATPAARLGRLPAGTIDPLHVALVLCSAEATGAASRALDASVAYAKQRKQFGHTIGSFQAIKHKLADMLLLVENGRSATYHAAWSLDGDADDPAIVASLAKAVATGNAAKVTAEAVQAHGAIAITWELDIHLVLRRAKACQLVLGSPDHHFDLLAAALLDTPEVTA
jgi:alkylation response protein AidB-like acyl-CoA dehydrogenase